MTTTEPAVTRLAPDHTVFQAWMEDNDWWDGYALYVDPELAKARAARGYEDDEYGYPDPDDEEPGARPEFAWTEDHGHWYLSDRGEDTRVRVAPVRVYRNATPDEAARQDAERAAREAAAQAEAGSRNRAAKST